MLQQLHLERSVLGSLHAVEQSVQAQSVPFEWQRVPQHAAGAHASQLPNAMSRLQVPKLMELIGLAYTTWFVYRYLLFKVRIPMYCTSLDVRFLFSCQAGMACPCAISCIDESVKQHDKGG
jgi:CAAD domains of cyanobacterial aminoacyl-tRNA synthetase